MNKIYFSKNLFIHRDNKCVNTIQCTTKSSEFFLLKKRQFCKQKIGKRKTMKVKDELK